MVLEREIKVIEELLEEEPESRCKSNAISEVRGLFPLGCLNSLVHYKRLLIRHRPDEKSILMEECQAMLTRLSTIDTMRQQRYKDICEYQVASLKHTHTNKPESRKYRSDVDMFAHCRESSSIEVR